MHRRMNETHGNLEIRNPIFDGCDISDDNNLLISGSNPAYTDDEREKSNFENPVYSYSSSPNRTDESRNLLIDDQSSLSRNSSLEESKFHPLA